MLNILVLGYRHAFCYMSKCQSIYNSYLIGRPPMQTLENTDTDIQTQDFRSRYRPHKGRM